MENDDIQDFDLRWEQALLLTSDPPSDKVLEGLYVSKLQDSFQAQTIMALENQEILRRKRDYHRRRMRVKLHVEQARRSKKFRIQSEITERVAVTEGTKFLHQAEDRRMLTVEGKWVLFKRTLLKFLHSRALGNRETSAEESKNTGVYSLKPSVNAEQRRKSKGQATSSVPTGQGQICV